MSDKWFVAALTIVLVSCNSPAPQQPVVEEKKTTSQKMSGPGDDDDRPVTMSGSSLDFTWDDWVDGLPLANADNDTRTYLYAWNNAAMVNQVKYHAKNASGRNGRVDFIRKKQNGLTIVINYHGTDEVKITSDNEENSSGVKTNPPNLKVISIAGGNAHMSDYEALGRFLLKHPTKGRKVRTITFSGVAMGTATGNHQCVASGQSYVCTVNGPLGDDDSRLRISVCRPSSLNPCPQPQ